MISACFIHPYHAPFPPIPILQGQVALSTAKTVRTTWIEAKWCNIYSQKILFLSSLASNLRTEDDVKNPFGNKSKNHTSSRSVGFIRLFQAKEPNEQMWLQEKPSATKRFNLTRPGHIQEQACHCQCRHLKQARTCYTIGSIFLSHEKKTYSVITLLRVIPTMAFNSSHLTFYLAFHVACLLTFYLAYLLTFILSDILSGMSSDILSGISSNILSGISSDIHSIWQSIWHIFWHSVWHIFWHSIWHSIWHIYLAYLLTFYLAYLSGIISGTSSDILSGISFGILSVMSSDILSGISSDILSGISIWHYIWNIFWHSIWHIFWHSVCHVFWHSIWHIFWHSIWHVFWHSNLAFSLAF